MIPIFKPFMPVNLSELNDILHSGLLSYGKWAKNFECQLKDYLGVERILTTNSYNSAMLVLIATLGLKPGDEVLASPMSCLASNQPFLNRSLTVKWVDIDPLSGTLDPDHLKKSITGKTKAIFHNHYCGIPGYIDQVNEIARSNGIFVVDDCIEAFGSEYNDRIIGVTGSDAAVYSFQTVRLPNTIEGGAIYFNNPELHNRAERLRDYGIDRKKFRDHNNEIAATCDIETEGYGAMMSDVNGYIGYEQMKEVPVLIQRQKDNGKSWEKIFQQQHPTVQVLSKREGIDPNFWVFGFLTDNKIEMLNSFRAQGYYASGIHVNNNIYSAFGDQRLLKGVESFAKRYLALPSGWWFKR